MTLLYNIIRLYPENKHQTVLVYDVLPQLMLDVYLNYYPGFECWYKEKVIPGFLNGSRIIHVVMSGDNKPVGVSIAKLSRVRNKPNKISSFMLCEEVTGQGFGTQLMNATIAALRHNSILSKTVIITIPEEKTYERINRRSLKTFMEIFEFREVARVSDRYRTGKDELVMELNLESY